MPHLNIVNITFWWHFYEFRVSRCDPLSNILFFFPSQYSINYTIWKASFFKVSIIKGPLASMRWVLMVVYLLLFMVYMRSHPGHKTLWRIFFPLFFRHQSSIKDDFFTWLGKRKCLFCLTDYLQSVIHYYFEITWHLLSKQSFKKTLLKYF